MLTVYGTQGSPGASTTAMHLAAHWASTGHEVLLIEADPTGGSLSQDLGIQFTPGSASFVASGLPALSNYLIDHAQDVLFENLHVMPAPANPGGARGIFQTLAGSCGDLRTISENEMAVIIDGGRLSAETAASQLTTEAAGVLVVCRDDSQLSSLGLLKETLAEGASYGGPAGCAAAIGKSPLGTEEWLDRYGLTFCGAVETVSDMTADLSTFLNRNKRKAKKWRLSLEQLGEKLYAYAQPPPSESFRRPRPEANAPELGTESADISAEEVAAPAPPAQRAPAGHGHPAPEPVGHAPPIIEPQPAYPAPAPETQPGHPPVGSEAQLGYPPPVIESQPGYPPPGSEAQPGYGQPHQAAPVVPQDPHSYPQAAPVVPQDPHSYPQAAPVVPQDPHSYPQAAPGTDPPGPHPSTGYQQPYPPSQTHQSAPDTVQGVGGFQAEPYPPSQTHQSAPDTVQGVGGFQAEPYPPSQTHQSAPDTVQGVGGFQAEPYPPSQTHQSAPARGQAPPVHPDEEASEEEPPAEQPPPRPDTEPSGSFRDWAAKLHGSKADDATAANGGS